MKTFTVEAIDPARLARMRVQGTDEHGNPWLPYEAHGWEPVRCCLRRADAGERVVLISYSPWTAPSPWAEAGPVFVHDAPCGGYAAPGAVPDFVGGSRRLLRPYLVDGSMAYDHIRFVDEDEDVASALTGLLAEPDVAQVHIRTDGPGCLLCVVR